MFDNIGEIFKHHDEMMGARMKKAQYKQNMYNFRVENGAEFQDMVDHISAADDKEKDAAELSLDFVNKTFDNFSKKGKIRSAEKASLNMFMILYVFPAILLTNSESAKTACDALKSAWNTKFNEHIDYTDYDTLYDGFKEKLFGIF